MENLLTRKNHSGCPRPFDVEIFADSRTAARLLSIELVRDDAVVDAADPRLDAVAAGEQLPPPLDDVGGIDGAHAPAAFRSSRSRDTSSASPARSP